jgi:purine-nucleoside phosphorylase
MKLMDDIAEAVSYIRDQGVDEPDVTVILGTGLGNLFVQQINNPLIIPYKSIPNFPESTVASHKSQLVFGSIHLKKVLVMQGRFHYYEGYTMKEVTFPVRVIKTLGSKYLLISNAAGNLNLHWHKSSLMLINDHINLFPDNPLRGKNNNALWPQFPDMSQPYDLNMNNLLLRIAKENNIELHQGVYAGVSGPSMETRAECRFLKKIGADAVGMSTVPEVIAANHLGLPCCAVSVLTNTNDPDNLQAVSFQDVLSTAKIAEEAFVKLYVELIKQLN